MENRFLVESTEIETAAFPCKTALSEVNIKANGIGTSYKELIWCTNKQISILILFRSVEVLIEDAFSLWVSLISSILLTRAYINIQQKYNKSVTT